jgi:hypothetical protein
MISLLQARPAVQGASEQRKQTVLIFETIALGILTHYLKFVVLFCPM